MNAPYESVPTPGKSKTWLIIAIIAILACLCILVVALVLGWGLWKGELPTTAQLNPSPTFTMMVEPTATASPLPTATPVPSSTPTPLPVPTQSLSSIINALQPAAQEKAVPGAADYNKGATGIHPIVIIVAVDQDDWNSSLPDAWLPSNVSEAELVAVVRYIDVEIEKARYFAKGSGIFFVSRIRRDTEVILREARTGNNVAYNVFKGSEPPTLSSTLPIGTRAVYGASVAYETVQVWLKSFVDP